MTELASIITDLERQRAAIDRALVALQEVTGGTKAAATAAEHSQPSRTKPHFSPETRKRMSEASRKRWAAFRKAKKTTTKKRAV